MTLLTAFWLSWQSHTFFTFFGTGQNRGRFRARRHPHAVDAKHQHQWIHRYVY